jgi:glycosyltransferase involved in cell wall biosynthesis
MKTLERYLKRKADNASRSLEVDSMDTIDQVIVIPAYDELDYLPDTLESLSKQPRELLSRTLVLLVANNRPPDQDDAMVIANNQTTIEFIRDMIDESGPWGSWGLRAGLIDASSPGKELAEKEGVGTARKLGLDWGLELFHRQQTHGILINLDADTPVAPNYLESITRHFAQPDTWAAVLEYTHPLTGSDAENEAIAKYESYLRLHKLGLRYAGSPYAIHTIGSTMVCTTQAYAAISGMNAKLAGEDFYFLQQLVKTGKVDTIQDVLVYPSSRISARTPFGTGPALNDLLNATDAPYEMYNPKVYRILKEWLATVEKSLGDDGGTLLIKSALIDTALTTFLETIGFKQHWKQLKENTSSDEKLLEQFHGWFDGLTTLKCIHHLRDHGLGNMGIADVANQLNDWIEKEKGAGLFSEQPDGDPVKLLDQLRSMPVLSD